MKTFASTAVKALVVSAGLLAYSTSAFALGACGPNFHRGPYGHCRFGGQNQAWCARHTGHAAGYGPNGTRWCR